RRSRGFAPNAIGHLLQSAAASGIYRPLLFLRGGRAMPGAFLRVALLALLTVPQFGCSWLGLPLGPWGGPAYMLDGDKVGSGQQAITPTNDAQHWNGESMDARRNH